ncbi:MAG: zinc dependent phospholipase C family protein [Cellvibrionaceae bacterium]|nr:zinc dependent phospholipase C family protein [Cellvibrionaceae bacterium]
MPFTPVHMGPGIAIKALLQGSFSLIVFGWTQIVMDIQPLIVILTGEGHLHGFSHSYVGASLLAIFSALSGKYLSEIGLYILELNPNWEVKIAWWIAFLSAFIGAFSHVAIDSIMHSDMEPFFPFSKENPLLGAISVEILHKLCLFGALIGAFLYYGLNWRLVRLGKGK